MENLIKENKNLDLVNRLKVQKEEINEKNKILTTELSNSLDSYLQNLPESPLLLPIKIKILIEKKNFVVDHVMVMNNDNTNKLYDIVTGHFSTIGDPIIDLKNSHFIVKKTVFSEKDGKTVSEDFVKVIGRETKILSTGLSSGETLIFTGDYITKSEEPKYCIKHNFEAENKGKEVRYFCCDLCNLNWICETCALICHKEHNIKLFKDKHIADWACCYCVKRNCTLKNK